MCPVSAQSTSGGRLGAAGPPRSTQQTIKILGSIPDQGKTPHIWPQVHGEQVDDTLNGQERLSHPGHKPREKGETLMEKEDPRSRMI